MKYRIATCPVIRGWTYQPIDMRKKHYMCLHCHELHETRVYVRPHSQLDSHPASNGLDVGSNPSGDDYGNT